MAPAALIPALCLIAGAAAGIAGGSSLTAAGWIVPACSMASLVAWQRRAPRATVVLLAIGFAAAGAALAADARERALDSPLRAMLDAELGEFAIDALGPENDHDPVLVRARLVEDAAAREDFVSLRARVRGVALGGHWRSVAGGVVLTVSGAAAGERILEWRAGRTIEAAVVFRRPARYLNDGVPDFERNLALDGTTLFGSIKSALLVEVTAPGSFVEERAADLRAHVRRAVVRWIPPRDAVAAAIVTAVLIGDRTGLPDEVRDRLQAAGTYHVIAISGGNIAILAGLVFGLLMLIGASPRIAAAAAIAALLAYSQIATAGPSVWRATLMAVLYLGARLLDHRTAPWQATGLAAAIMVVAWPLDIRDPGFILTFGATAALLEVGRVVGRVGRVGRAGRVGGMGRVGRAGGRWLLASIAASFAAEIALLPVSAQTFSRVTSAGLLLNLVAVPMMGVAQIAGIAVVAFDGIDAIGAAAGRVAGAAATALVESARLVDAAPWLTARVPPPGFALVALYYLALGASLVARRIVSRVLAMLTLAAALATIAGLWGPPGVSGPPSGGSGLRVTMFDVGQAEAMLVEADGRTLQVDAGGAPFGSGAFDVGARVLAPALWARGIRQVDALLTTHGDPDHVGGAAAVISDFAVGRLWEGIEVARHQPTRLLREAAAAAGARVERRRAGESFAWGKARIRVLHPPEPDWERPRIRNDDSVVLEILYGDVALLLTGDIGADVERAIAPQLTPARVRILKVGHHGSRTSTSQLLLDAWPPHVALISAGRGNTFGHPTPEVLGRLESVGAEIYRTDRDGQITLETDGRDVQVRTFTGEKK